MINDGRDNTYKFVLNGRNISLKPMKTDEIVEPKSFSSCEETFVATPKSTELSAICIDICNDQGFHRKEGRNKRHCVSNRGP